MDYDVKREEKEKGCPGNNMVFALATTAIIE